MRYESAVALKASLLGDSVSHAIVSSSSLPQAARAATTSARVHVRPPFPFAIGITGKGQDHKLAIRIQETPAGIQRAVSEVFRRSRGECEVKLVGQVVKQVPWHRRRQRPLQIGSSCGHFAVTAGTLGCFAKDRANGEHLILSNNHVLANENNAEVGDAILQPGKADGGKRSNDKIGELHRFEPIRSNGNLIDAATASLAYDTEYYVDYLDQVGPISGVRTNGPEIDEVVYKVGRTTGLTRGRVSAIDVDKVLVGYDTGDFFFSGQFEIEPDGNQPFSLGGDSGSLIVDRYRRALGLLFAGNDVDTTYANPISTVLDRLRVCLMHD